MELNWLDNYEEETALGPLQREEALMLYALARVMRPQVVVEFGVAYGHSARAWLEAGVPLVIGVDPWQTTEALSVATQYGERFRYIQASMTDVQIDERPDIVFFDAEHDLSANVAAYNNLKHLPRTIIVHDTGTWAAAHMMEIHRTFPGVETQNGKIHQPAEVAFCGILAKDGWQRINFHSKHTLRHGMTILQKL